MPTTTKPKRPRKPAPPPRPSFDHRAILAARLDRLADLHLQQGYSGTAEHLAHRASMLREGAR